MPPAKARLIVPVVARREARNVVAGTVTPLVFDPSTQAVVQSVYQRQQIAIASQAIKALELLFGDIVDADGFMDSMDTLQPLVDSATALHYHAAAASAAQYYISLRVGLGYGHRGVPGVGLPKSMFQAMFRATGIDSFWRAIDNGLDEGDAVEKALGDLSGGVERLVMKGGRDQIEAATDSDPASEGMERVANPGACDYCQSLAGTDEGGFHDHCGCTMSPVFKGG